MKEFEFNTCNVCINPNRYEFESGNRRCSIRTATNNGKWGYGITIMLPNEGLGSPLTLSDCTHESEEEAFKEAKEKISNWVIRRRGHEDFLTGIRDSFFLFKQPTLFDLWGEV